MGSTPAIARYTPSLPLIPNGRRRPLGLEATGGYLASEIGASAVAKDTPKPPTAPVLLAGGNPQIAKGEGDGPVQAYIAAMPGWKSQVGRRLDGLIAAAVPGVRKAVKWNSPFYGVEGKGWFASFHVFTRYVKLTFFQGADLQPPPPGSTPKSGATRWLDLHEREWDEAQLADWIRQAAAIPGWLT